VHTGSRIQGRLAPLQFPRPDLPATRGGKERNIVEYGISHLNELAQAAPTEVDIGQERSGFLWSKDAQVGLKLCAYDDTGGLPASGVGAHLFSQRPTLWQIAFAHIGDIDQRLCGQQIQPSHLIALVGIEILAGQPTPPAEPVRKAMEGIDFGGMLAGRGLGAIGNSLDLALHQTQVR